MVSSIWYQERYLTPSCAEVFKISARKATGAGGLSIRIVRTPPPLLDVLTHPTGWLSHLAAATNA
jgi:hypothetical protein